MVRIRYKKDQNKLISQRPLLCHHRFVNIVLHMDKMLYQITDADTQDVLAEGISGTLLGLKKCAKDAAKHLGATFFDEVRNTKTLRRFKLDER